MYHYAGNNPVKYTDPDGRIVISANTSIMMTDSSNYLGTSNEKICDVGCVLTAYTRKDNKGNEYVFIKTSEEVNNQTIVFQNIRARLN